MKQIGKKKFNSGPTNNFLLKMVDTVANVIKNGIMNFRSNPVHSNSVRINFKNYNNSQIN